MAILSLNKLEAKGFKSKLSNKLKFYKGDRLNLGFSISSDLISNIGSKEVINGILPIDSDNIEAKMLIEGHEIEGTIIEDNNVVFLLEPRHQTVGVTQFQIVIIEHLEDGSKEILHTPPFPIEIAEPIGYYETEQARVGYALVGKSRVAAPSTVTASIDYEYNMTVWETGDLITADRLNNIEMALDSLLYKAISISNFCISRSTAEYGESINSLTLSWTFSKIPTYQMLDGVELDISQRNYEILGPITSNRSFRLEASDGKTTASKSVGVNFYNGRYHGVSEEGVYDSNFIKKLTKTLTNSRQNTFTVNCISNQYIFFAIPTRFGTPTFSVGGFSGGFIKESTIDFTNNFGYTESYDIWKSENHSLGNTTVVVG